MMFHAVVVCPDRRAVGYVRAASYGHALGGAVGLAMIDPGVPLDEEYLRDAAGEVEIAGKRYAAVASIRSRYDPENARVKR